MYLFKLGAGVQNGHPSQIGWFMVYMIAINAQDTECVCVCDCKGMKAKKHYSGIGNHSPL